MKFIALIPRHMGLLVVACGIGVLLSAVGVLADGAKPLDATPLSDNKSIHRFVSGIAEVALFPCDENGEFPPSWQRKLSFQRTPETICGRWSVAKPVAAKWEVYHRNGAGIIEVLAAGTLSQAALQTPSPAFSVSLRPALPEFNDMGAPKDYFVRVTPVGGTTPASRFSSRAAKLTHLPRPPRANPYACSDQDGAQPRLVRLEIPEMTVIQTTDTNGDGDRDELYMKVVRTGPSAKSRVRRLPTGTGGDNYYEAIQGRTVASNDWTDRDQHSVGNPVIWHGTIGHNELASIALVAAEQDNADLHDIRIGIEAAMHAVAAFATAAGGPYGLAVAATAEGVNVATQTGFDDIEENDLIGPIKVTVQNRCGFITINWVTYSAATIAGRATSNHFEALNNLDHVEDRLIVLEPASQFWPDGVDWGIYAPSGVEDEFWWVANGTGNSSYRFLMRASILTPSN